MFDHPFHQLLEDAHLPPALETFVDYARGDPEPIPMDGLPLPLTSRPKHVPDAVDDRSIGGSRSATSPTLPLLGQALLELSPEGSGEAEVIDGVVRCVRLSHKARLL